MDGILERSRLTMMRAAVDQLQTEAREPQLRTMMREYRGWVHRCLRGAGVPQRDVDDVAQEVWCVLAEKLATFEPVGAKSVSAWLEWICRFKVMEYRNELAGRPEVPARLGDERSLEWRTGAAPSVEDRILECSRITLLRAAVDQLRTEAPTLYPVMAAELAGVPMPHVATELRTPLGTVYTRLRRGHQVVRAQLRRWEDDTRGAARTWLDAMGKEPCM